MNCEHLQDVIVEVAAGTADDIGARMLRNHLATGCPVCAGRLAEAETIAGQLPLALEPVAPSPELRERLMARVAQAPREVATVPRSAVPSSWARPVVAAAIAASLVGFAVYLPLARDRDSLREAVARQTEAMGRLDRDLRSASDTLRVLRSPSVQVVSLGGGAPQPEARGRIFWDRARGEWLFYAAEMAPPGTGRTYELWLINEAGAKIPAGTFDVDARGEAELRVALPKDAGTIVVAAVTDEPAGGVPQPTGKIQLVGKVQPPPA